ncbi:glutathione S-transferase family protein [Scytonema sp. NUACC21]
MLKFFYNPISVNARRVWIALIEKQILFEPVLVNLDGDQFNQEFTAINPLQRIPVIVDNGFRVVESLAILDYLEAKYPNPSLMPTEPEDIAIVRMVNMVAINELQLATITLSRPLVGLETSQEKLEMARERAIAVLQFYESLLVGKSYFVEDKIMLCEVVVGTLVPSIPLYGLSLEPYPNLNAWSQRLQERASWQQTTPNDRAIESALPNIRKILERRS